MIRSIPFVLLTALCAASGAVAGPSITQFGVTINNSAAVAPGNVLFVDCNPPNPDAGANVYLVSQTGKQLKAWRNDAMIDLAKPIGTDGTVVTWRHAPQTGSGCGDTLDNRALYKIGPTSPSKISRVFAYNASYAQNSDFEVIPDGTFLVLRKTLVTNTAISSVPFYDDQIVRVDASGNVLWTWSTADHYSQLGLTTGGRNTILAGQTLYSPASNVFDTDSIQYIPPNSSAALNSAFSPGNILVSEHNTNLIFAIDYATGNIVWQVGNISVGQQDVKMIPTGLPGDGHLLFYNNGGKAGYPPTSLLYSSIVEYDPIAKLVTWQYQSQVPALYGLDSFWNGSAQRLPNGNTFIDEAGWGRFFEVDTSGNIVWEYLYPFKSDPQAPDRNIYRAYKVATCWPGCNPEPGLTTSAWTW